MKQKLPKTEMTCREHFHAGYYSGKRLERWEIINWVLIKTQKVLTLKVVQTMGAGQCSKGNLGYYIYIMAFFR